MAELVSLAAFKHHLQIPIEDTYRDVDLQLKLRSAEAIILDYLSDTTDDDWTAALAGWDEQSVPLMVHAAVLLQGAELLAYRGDGEGPKRTEGDLSPTIAALLRRVRRPVVA
jgi:hypothetical protein